MEALTVSLEVRPFRALLNGLRMKLFPVSGESISDEEIEQIFLKSNAELDINDIRNEITLFESILKKAATDNWLPEVLQEFLETRGFPADHTTLFTEFWRKESPKVHSHLLQQVSYNHSMQHIAWRVDMKALSKNAAEANVPVAYFELNLLSGRTDNSGLSDKQAVKFDMNRSEVQQMVEQLNAIQETYDKLLAK